MNAKAQALADQFRTFNDQLIDFVKNVPESGMAKNAAKGEEWTVGVVARHVGVGHYGSIELAQNDYLGRLFASIHPVNRSTTWETPMRRSMPIAAKKRVVSILEKKRASLGSVRCRAQRCGSGV